MQHALSIKLVDFSALTAPGMHSKVCFKVLDVLSCAGGVVHVTGASVGAPTLRASMECSWARMCPFRWAHVALY
jgi:hypothetical protein